MVEGQGRARPARYVPDVALPPYSYVTGRSPHPTGDPRGHSFGHAWIAEKAPDAENWRDSREYLLGIDLFNHGYYWEAHEVWEAAWNACGRRGLTADFIKGLIKLAAAGVKAREGRPEGVHRHAARAAQLFENTLAAHLDRTGTFFGLNLAELIGHARHLKAAQPCQAADSHEVVPVLGVELSPII